ncbi:hypothetical protein K7J14_05415 [Treponema zuelzerae]|uniref:Uncharacterized protein n=1 Tax=Teretinema zuelzerae TaxID=156 RepID=A0AAE3EGD4_9SPIR|nr:hypothetical protein [Teretinema zuelzerae]MBN2811160.1 hypothetical protein [Spirochaetales bacterium]MCD1654137.1 hypothetical protein [Teretinema zuelzerae]HPO01717.1 hypothetical protein [Treponemataceae bacterium]
MKKRSLIIAALLFAASASLVWAQEAPKKVLSAKDVSAFISNYDSIQTDMDALGDKYDDFFDMEDETAADPGAMIAYVRGLSIPAEIQGVFKKNGFGDNGFEKFIVISYGASVIYMEEMMATQMDEYKDMPEMQAYIEQASAGVKAMRETLHDSDLSLIKARKDELIALLMEEGEE